MAETSGQSPKPLPRSTTPGPLLSLPRRRPVTRPPFPEIAAASRDSITSIVEATRASLQRSPALAPEQVAELERSLRTLELSLGERQRLVAESEARLAERERDFAEMEALLSAREKLLAVSRRGAGSPVAVSGAEQAALELFRDTLSQQEAHLKETKQALREREQFLDESEAKLFAKVQAQQEKESELEQREDDLRARQRRDRETRATFDPTAAEELKAEDAALKKRDEFNE